MNLNQVHLFIIAVVSCLLLLLLCIYQCFRRPVQPPAVRAIWVTRFDYMSKEDVERIFKNLSMAGFTDVFFQVRGNGTTFYPSKVELWAYELSGTNVANTGKAPGWNPLQCAIEASHKSGIRIHAYANVLPGWRGREDPPEAVRQLWTAHRDWFMMDITGDRMKPTSGWYTFLNPVHPEVRKHLRAIFSELSDYDIDGIHLDYIRYPHDYYLVAGEHYPDLSRKELMKHSLFSYDQVTLSVFSNRYGRFPEGRLFDDFRRDAITKVVRDIRYIIQAKRTNDCLLSAAVMGDMRQGYSEAFQDSGTWVRQGLIDWAVIMNYDAARFDRRLKSCRRIVGRAGLDSVVVGILCTHNVEEIIREIKQVERSGCHGYALFAYSHLYKDHKLTPKGQRLLMAIR